MPSAFANSFSIGFPKNEASVFMYDVIVNIICKDGKKIPLNKENSNAQDKTYCRALLRLVAQRSEKFAEAAYVYDGCAIAFVNKRIGTLSQQVEVEKFTGVLVNAIRRPVEVVLAPAERYEIKLVRDFTNIDEASLSLIRQFLALLIDQDGLDRDEFFVQGKGFLYSNKNVEKTEHGYEYRIGYTKSFPQIAVGKETHIAVEIDFRCSAFYSNLSILEIQRRVGRNADKFIGRVLVAPTYHPHRVLKFDKTNPGTTAGTYTFDLGKPDGTTQQCTVAKYYRDVYNIAVNNNSKLINVHPNNAGLFPPEVLMVRPYQKVRNERLEMLDSHTALPDLHARNVVKPEVRHQEIVKILRSLNLTPSNPILKAFGITVNTNFAKVDVAADIYRPNVSVGRNVSRAADNATFSPRGNFAQPARMGSWVLLHTRETTPEQITGFLRNLADRGKLRGFTLPNPTMVQEIDPRNFATGAFVKIGTLKNISYILYIENKRSHSNSHGLVKLIEPKYKIVVQQLDAFTVRKVADGRSANTADNILNKMNLKNGGLNFVPQFEGEAKPLALEAGTFVVSYQAARGRLDEVLKVPGMNEPVRSYTPAVIGFVGNYSANPNLFVGNYRYQEEDGETFSETIPAEILTEQMKHMLLLLGKNRPAHARPKTIIVLRDGISSYAYKDFADHEVPALLRGCQLVDKNYKPKIVAVVVTKRHTSRIFGDQFKNPISGTVVDKSIVRKDNEFFIIPQRALIGTAKPVKATVVHNDSGITVPALEKFLHSLSYSHQLTNGATGLPEPVYQASELVKRGSYILTAFKNYFSVHLPRKENKTLDVHKVNNMLSFKGSRLEVIRFTA